ncbi:MAG: S-layer homology domain-containing protein, partial [Chloroflexia bacterium]
YGLNADTGGQLWREQMNVGGTGFPWASPLLAYGRSYLGMASCADNPSVRGEVRSLNMNDGSGPVSQYFVPAGQHGAGIWNSPALSPDGSAVVATTGEDYGGYNGPYNRALVSMDPITLAILQSNQQGTLNGDVDYATTPLFFSDSQSRVLVGAVHKNGSFYAYELNSINSGPIWSRALSGYSAGLMPAYDPTYGAGGTLFVANASRLYALDPNTGADRWPFISVSGLHGNVALANGLLFLNVAGNLQIRNRTNGALLRTLNPSTGGSTYTGPVVSHGFVYWLSGAWLNAWSLPAGTPTETPTPGSSNTPTNTSVPTNTPTNTTVPTTTPTRTNTRVFTSTSTQTSTPFPTSTRTPTLANTSTTLPTSTPTTTSLPPTLTSTSTSTNTAQPTSIPTETPIITPTACTLAFEDVPPDSTFYPYIQCLSCLGIINGYPCGGIGEPCNGSSDPYFRPGANITRGQLSKVVASAAGFSDPATGQTFEDVPPSSTFYTYIERLATRSIMSGYPCGGAGEPCGSGNKPYFRPGNNATRGQIAKIVSSAANLGGDPSGQTFQDVPTSSTFWLWIERLYSSGAITGYPCGNPEPCVPPDNKPYFRPSNTATRGQVSKIVSTTFFPSCPINQ